MKVDLHIHTIASDGCWSPSELVREIKKFGIELFSVTDHDSIGSVKETRALAKKEGLHFIPGVELTSKFNGKICHVLGYNIDEEAPNLVNICNANTDRMKQLNIEQIKQAIKDGFPLDLAEFMSYKFDKSRGGGTVTNYLLDKKIFATFNDALGYVAKNLDWQSPDYPSPGEVASIIKTARGHPILAHPGSTLLSAGLLDHELEALIDSGIEGLECYTNYHDEPLTNKFIEFCHKKDLLITAGSDCHGPLLKKRILGKASPEFEKLNLKGIWPK